MSVPTELQAALERYIEAEANNHDEITLVGDRGGCAEDVLKRGAIHRRP